MRPRIPATDRSRRATGCCTWRRSVGTRSPPTSARRRAQGFRCRPTPPTRRRSRRCIGEAGMAPMSSNWKSVSWHFSHGSFRARIGTPNARPPASAAKIDRRHARPCPRLRAGPCVGPHLARRGRARMRRQPAASLGPLPRPLRRARAPLPDAAPARPCSPAPRGRRVGRRSGSRLRPVRSEPPDAPFPAVSGNHPGALCQGRRASGLRTGTASSI